MSALTVHERRFAARIANVRRLRGFSQQDLAMTTGMHRSVVAGIETGVRGIKLGEAVALCAALDVDLCEMVAAEPMKLRIETPVD